MSKKTVRQAKGTIDNRFFIAITERVGKSIKYLAIERIGNNGCWKRNYITPERHAKLCGLLKASA